MEIIKSNQLTESQKLDIIRIWNQEYPKAIALKDLQAFEDYLVKLSDKHHLLLTDELRNVMGWLMYFYRDGERNFAILLCSSLQGKGYGGQLLNEAKKQNEALVGWAIDNNNELKENGTCYQSPLSFYRKNGFEILPEIQIKKSDMDFIKIKWAQAIK